MSPPALNDSIAERAAECRPGPAFREWLKTYLPPGHTIGYAQLVIDAHAEFDHTDKPTIRNWLTAMAADGNGGYSFRESAGDPDRLLYQAAPRPGRGDKGGA